MSPLLRLTLPLVLLLVACAKGPGKPEGHIPLPPDAVVLATDPRTTRELVAPLAQAITDALGS